MMRGEAMQYVLCCGYVSLRQKFDGVVELVDTPEVNAIEDAL